MEKAKVVQPHEIQWEPHPQLEKVKVGYLLSNRDEKADLTCFFVSSPVGTQMEKHSHDDSDDIAYVIKGKAKVWIDQIGEVPLAKGVFVRIPKGVPHRVYDIEEDLLTYNVLHPFLI